LATFWVTGAVVLATVVGAVVLVVLAAVWVTGAVVLATVVGAVVLVVLAAVLLTVLVVGAVVLVVLAAVLLTVLVVGAATEEMAPVALETGDELSADALAVQTVPAPSARMPTTVARRSRKRAGILRYFYPFRGSHNRSYVGRFLPNFPWPPSSGNVSERAWLGCPLRNSKAPGAVQSGGVVEAEVGHVGGGPREQVLWSSEVGLPNGRPKGVRGGEAPEALRLLGARR
jgi:hypothetical protein